MRVSLAPSQRSQAALPLRCATSCGPAARLAALCSWLVKEGSGAPLPAGFASAEEAVLELCEDDDPLCKSWRERPDLRVPPREACSQKSWSAAIAKRSIRIQCQSASRRDSVRLRFVCGGDILPWLAAPPSKALDTGCGPPALRLLLKWHLGCPIMDTSFGSPLWGLPRTDGRFRGSRGLLPSWASLASPLHGAILPLSMLLGAGCSVCYGAELGSR